MSWAIFASAIAGAKETSEEFANDFPKSAIPYKTHFFVDAQPANDSFEEMLNFSIEKSQPLALSASTNSRFLMNATLDTLFDDPYDAVTLPKGRRSPILAAALSAILPGAGEFYAESYVRGAIFLAVEIVGWVVYINKLNDGHQAEHDFVNYANTISDDGKRRWDARRYAQGLSKLYSDTDLGNDAANNSVAFIGTDDGLTQIEAGDYSQLNLVEQYATFSNGSTFSHVLPSYGEQQYYELIGKYSTYTIGWYDFDATYLSKSFSYKSSSFLEYAAMRGDANGLLKDASTVLSLIVLNHALSIADAVLATSAYNDRFSTNMEVRCHPVTGEFIPYACIQFGF
ncbi:hypothetical protein [Chloroherpeton thalassium]|uniref:hypothetical protein n=1 Tax=Chloroherpeton thalassium TaxID=100716 RepID=UPI001B7F8789|nr:hypothetical protein [Chloroherpeton thalassium]